MRAYRRSLLPHLWLPGNGLALLLWSMLGLILLLLYTASPINAWYPLFTDRYLWHILFFTFWQAGLSTLLSLVPALFVARALARRRFPGHQLLLQLCATTLALPALVAIIGLIAIYGQTGWLAQLCHAIGVDWRPSPYGLPGILLAHSFYNLPLATRLLLQTLQQVPAQHRKIAAQLALSDTSLFRIVEWPRLKRPLASIGLLLFMLCFSSFTIVLTLGGGPRATTLEVAIFQALSYDFNPGSAVILALLQVSCCLLLLLASQRLPGSLSPGDAQQSAWRDRRDTPVARVCDTLAIALLLLLLVPPLLAVMIDGLRAINWHALLQPALGQSMVLSLCIALASGVLTLLISLTLLLSSRRWRQVGQYGCATFVDSSGLVLLAVPGIVLGTGAWLIINQLSTFTVTPAGILIVIHALMATPYAIKILQPPLNAVAHRYSWLCQSLNLTGWRRLWHIELPLLSRPLRQALLFAITLSLGDVSAIALLSSADFTTLPLRLLQQISAFHLAEAHVTAFILLLSCLLVATLIEKFGHCYAYRR